MANELEKRFGATGGRPATAAECFSYFPLVLDIDYLVRGGAFRPGRTTAGTITWSNSDTGATRAEIGYTANMDGARHGFLRLRYRSAGVERKEMIDFIAEPVPFGGLRWAVECPIRRSLARKLYLLPGGRRFASRLAYGLTYASRCDSVQERPMRQAQALRMRLGGGPNLDAPYPDKPPWRRWATYNTSSIASMRTSCGRHPSWIASILISRIAAVGR